VKPRNAKGQFARDVHHASLFDLSGRARVIVAGAGLASASATVFSRTSGRTGLARIRSAPRSFAIGRYSGTLNFESPDMAMIRGLDARLAQFIDQLQSIHVWHHDVCNDQVVQLGFVKRDAGLAVIGWCLPCDQSERNSSAVMFRRFSSSSINRIEAIRGVRF